MKTSNDTNDIMLAIAKIQDQLKPLHKDTRGFNYKYVTWESIVTHIRPLLSSNDLVCVQSTGTPPSELWPAIKLTTRFVHLISNQWIEDSLVMPLPDDAKNIFQATGSGITYAKRYMFTSMLGVIDSKDSDGTYSEKPPLPTIDELTAEHGNEIILEAMKHRTTIQEILEYIDEQKTE